MDFTLGELKYTIILSLSGLNELPRLSSDIILKILSELGLLREILWRCVSCNCILSYIDPNPKGFHYDKIRKKIIPNNGHYYFPQKCQYWVQCSEDTPKNLIKTKNGKDGLIAICYDCYKTTLNKLKCRVRGHQLTTSYRSLNNFVL